MAHAYYHLSTEEAEQEDCCVLMVVWITKWYLSQKQDRETERHKPTQQFCSSSMSEMCQLLLSLILLQINDFLLLPTAPTTRLALPPMTSDENIGYIKRSSDILKTISLQST